MRAGSPDQEAQAVCDAHSLPGGDTGLCCGTPCTPGEVQPRAACTPPVKSLKVKEVGGPGGAGWSEGSTTGTAMRPCACANMKLWSVAMALA